MNKLTLGIYRILTVVVMLSMTFGMVGPASALTPQKASQAAPPTQADATPYDALLNTNPYAAMLKDAPLPELSLADVAAMDTASRWVFMCRASLPGRISLNCWAIYGP